MPKPQRHVAFLRGMNLGKRRLPMSDLRDLFIELGFEEVETFIASGNVIFATDVTASKLPDQIAQHLRKSLGYQVDTFVRTTTDVKKIGASQSFPEDGDPAYTIHVGFLQKKLPANQAAALAAIATEKDAFQVTGKEFYWRCLGKISESDVWKLPETKAIKLPTHSMRNMTSIRKLIAKHLD